VAKVDLGRSVTFERVTGYWGRDLPVNIGRHNFDRIRYEYFRDRSAALEAFKAGAYDLREEFTAKSWVTEYDFPALRQGLVQRAVLEDAQPSGVQGFFLNTRRHKFQDRRVREALDLAFDFEWTNKALFHGQYERTDSIFENSDLAAQGEPSQAELALLEPFRDRLDAAVFGPAYVPPRTDGSGRNRDNLRQAQRLLEQAGWRIMDGVLRDARGTPFTIEFLGFETTFERVVAPYARNLAHLGIQASFRLVDMAQYQRRVQDFDFDVTTSRFVQPNTPGIEQRNYWSCAAAQTIGSFNLAGICDPAVDALVEAIIDARSRAELRTATRALDRVVMHGRHMVPHWYKGSHWIAYWDRFGRPPEKPKYDRGILDLWWYAPDKAARLAAARK
jgi:microcin C transport system substrate-binding protein